MSSTKSKLRVMAAMAALAALAVTASCTGFFPGATIQSIALQPPTPTLAVTYSQQMEAWATDSNNNRYKLTSNVVWQLTDVTATDGGTVATLSPAGLLTATSQGTATVQASAEGITGSTTATIVEVVQSMTIKPGTAQIPDDGSTTANFTVSGVVQTQTGTQTQDLTPVVTLTAYQDGSAQSLISCTYISSVDEQQCTADQSLDITTNTTYTLLVTYGGYSGAPVSATLTVTPAPTQ
jgi:hypothetical protein